MLQRISHWIASRNRPSEDASRRECEILLDRIARSESLAPIFSPESAILIDARWDNPNHWARYSLFRAALGLSLTKEVCVLGEYRREEQRYTMANLGISHSEDLTAVTEFTTSNRKIAKRMIKELTQPDDILKWTFEEGVPAGCFYDYALKNQKWAFVRIDDPKLLEYLHHFLDQISIARRAVDRWKPELVLVSHESGDFAPLAWIACSRGIPVVNLFGIYGIPHFRKYRDTHDFFFSMTCPNPERALASPADRRTHLEAAGKESLDRRLGGKTKDLGAQCSYARNAPGVSRAKICEEFGWDPAKPIVAVYSSNWYDYPHWQGMHQFRDFHDWMLVTVAAAKANNSVNWLFRSHPVDEYWGGLSLGDIIPFDEVDHVKLGRKEWNGNDVIASVEAFVTFRGTIGIEATSTGKPVLVSERGWYTGWGFVKCPRSRLDYQELLATRWWDSMDKDANRRLSLTFSGMFWGRPAEQRHLVLEDDSNQWKLYGAIVKLFSSQAEEIRGEIAMMREWFLADDPFYHSHKMEKANHFLPYV